MKRMDFVCLHPDLGCSVIEGSMFKQSLIQPSLKEAAAIAIAVVALMSVAIIAWQWMPQMVILLAIVALVCYGRVRKVRIRDMQNHMTDAVSSGMGAIYLFFLIYLKVYLPTLDNTYLKITIYFLIFLVMHLLHSHLCEKHLFLVCKL